MVLLKDGTLHAMGHRNRCGQATASDNFYSPVLVNFGNNVKISSIACCSQECTIVKTLNNEWYAFGEPCFKSFPAYGKEVTRDPRRIDDAFPKNVIIKQLLATCHAFFMLCENGDLYVVGNGSNGEMGTKSTQIHKWTLFKQNVAFIQTGLFNSFVFLK